MTLGLGLLEDFTPTIFESLPPSMKNMTPELVLMVFTRRFSDSRF